MPLLILGSVFYTWLATAPHCRYWFGKGVTGILRGLLITHVLFLDLDRRFVLRLTLSILVPPPSTIGDRWMIALWAH